MNTADKQMTTRRLRDRIRPNWFGLAGVLAATASAWSMAFLTGLIIGLAAG